MSKRKTQISNEEFNAAYAKTDNIKIIKNVCSRYASQLSEDDLIRCGMIALWRCLQYHREGGGNKFTTSLHTFTEWECRRQLHEEIRNRQKYRHVDLDASIDYNISKDRCDIDLDECMGSLSETHRDVIHMRFFEKCTFADIGERMGFTRQAAKQHVTKALDKLKEQLCT